MPYYVSRNEMPVTSYFGYSGTNPMFTMFLKVQSVQKADFRA